MYKKREGGVIILTREFRIMSISEILDKALSIYKKYLGTLILYLLIIYSIIIPIAIVAMFVFFFCFSILAGVTGIASMQYENSIFFYVVFGVIFTIFYTFVISLQMIQTSGIVNIASSGFLNKKITLGKALKDTFKNILKVLSVIIALIVMILPVALFFVGNIIAITNNLGGELFDSFISIILIIIFSLILIYFVTIHAFAIHSAILENNYFFKALKRSRQLVKNNFWRVLGSLMLCGLVVTVISYSIYAFFGIIVGFLYIIFRFLNIEEEIWSILLILGNFIRIPVQILVSLCVAPIGSTLTTVLYYNQRFKKYGYDLELEISKLELNFNKSE